MTAQDVKDAHPVELKMDRLVVRCSCGWTGAFRTVDDAKHLARLHWALMEGRDGR